MKSNKRNLKIQPKHRFNRWSTSIVPELRLCGKWLKEIGFNENQRVEVHTEQNLIIIKPIE